MALPVTFLIELLYTLHEAWLVVLMPQVCEVPLPMSLAVSGSPIVFNEVQAVVPISFNVSLTTAPALPVKTIPAYTFLIFKLRYLFLELVPAAVVGTVGTFWRIPREPVLPLFIVTERLVIVLSDAPSVAELL